MEQFRQIGEVLGSMKALMIFHDDIKTNPRQCNLLLDMFNAAYESIGEELRHNLRFEEKNTKWRVIEQPLRALLRVYKEGDSYIRQSLETKNWWAKAITLYNDSDLVEYHIHNLLCCNSIVIEAIESAGEVSGSDYEEMQRKRYIYSMKYQKECKDPKLFQWKLGKQYLVSEDFCNRLDVVLDEDRWILLRKAREKRNSDSSNRDKKLADILIKKLDSSTPFNGKLLPCSILLNSKDYQVRRRLGSGSQYKEIQWLGESFAQRHFFGNFEASVNDISKVLSLSHPNIMNIFCAFADEEKKECFMVMELMTRDLSSYIKEICGTRKKFLPFSLPVAVDLMLQIARGMEYLHSKEIYHGNLNPSNVLMKSVSGEGYLRAKISGFGIIAPNDVNRRGTSSNPKPNHQFIWHPPEVLEEEEQISGNRNLRFTEKSDVYSFGMICFELLTGKVPFEDNHLQGDKMSRNIRTGERPLFPHPLPKYLTRLTKKCWHDNPSQRPSFSSICRVLRYIKRFLALNPDQNNPNPSMPVIDYFEIEAWLADKFPLWPGPFSVAMRVPFEMFAYRVVEKEKMNAIQRDTSESGSDGASVCGDGDEPFSPVSEKRFPLSPEVMLRKISSPIRSPIRSPKRSPDAKSVTQPGTPRGRSSRPPQLSLGGRPLRMSSESQLTVMSPRSSPKLRKKSGHASDSELS